PCASPDPPPRAAAAHGVRLTTRYSGAHCGGGPCTVCFTDNSPATTSRSPASCRPVSVSTACVTTDPGSGAASTANTRAVGLPITSSISTDSVGSVHPPVGTVAVHTTVYRAGVPPSDSIAIVYSG